jgi:hypothetical protein
VLNSYTLSIHDDHRIITLPGLSKVELSYLTHGANKLSGSIGQTETELVVVLGANKKGYPSPIKISVEPLAAK